MKESIGYTLTLNIAIVFIVIIFVFLSNIVIYYKAYKVSNMITSSIEKYEGFNDLAYNEIESKLSSIGYSKREIRCETDDKSKITKTFDDYTCINVNFYDEGKESFNFDDYKDMLDKFKNIEMVMTFKEAKSKNFFKGEYPKGSSGYCVYLCIQSKWINSKNQSLKQGEYFYRIKTNMYAEIPLLNNFINYSIYTDTNIMYDFEGILD